MGVQGDKEQAIGTDREKPGRRFSGAGMATQNFTHDEVLPQKQRMIKILDLKLQPTPHTIHESEFIRIYPLNEASGQIQDVLTA